jgi:hypothetical protein
LRLGHPLADTLPFELAIGNEVRMIFRGHGKSSPLLLARPIAEHSEDCQIPTAPEPILMDWLESQRIKSLRVHRVSLLSTYTSN